ncbi:MAG: NUDIX domain-containing protein [Thermomicrobiales bacterium]|nr:NUDIX domain-containing protein [Thermomicrobiales bacterium]MCO5226195.1 NUDIX domain-containing protein [Thermomicrobiales bacterium]MCO5228365.1 NUDIX domain-containing protein [Thermomicrobiales bacterium]
MQLAQDPNEYFDVVTEEGEPTGISKRRADVHRDGDWHRAVHVWFYGVDAEGPFVLLNLRGRNKDTSPLALDPTVGGHLGAGETVEDAFREVFEEIGVYVDPERYEFVFRRRTDSENNVPGIIDRELQDVYLVRDDRPLAAYAPNFAELEGLVKVGVADIATVFRGERESCQGLLLNAETGDITPYTLLGEGLSSRGVTPYFTRAISEIELRSGL